MTTTRFPNAYGRTTQSDSWDDNNRARYAIATEWGRVRGVLPDHLLPQWTGLTYVTDEGEVFFQTRTWQHGSSAPTEDFWYGFAKDNGDLVQTTHAELRDSDAVLWH